MLNCYPDITNRIKENPIWYDGNGVPRYDNFYPDSVPNIYATEALLLKISCQYCDREFLVGMDFCEMSKLYNPRASSFVENIKSWMKENIKYRWFPVHFGDPPNHGCIGDTMNCIDHKIIEFWQRENHDWKRKKEYEIYSEEE